MGNNSITDKSVVIRSIGEATPVVSKILSDGLGLPEQAVLNAVYQSPSVLFSKVDEETAIKAEKLLKTLGLEVSIESENYVLPVQKQVEVGIYLQDPLLLPVVANQLATFLGCEEKVAMNLLLNDPAIVLGGVSRATAEALSKRIDAEVIISESKKALYTLLCRKDDASTLSKVHKLLARFGVTVENDDQCVFEDIPYTTAMSVWKNMRDSESVVIKNQDFRRYEIVLDNLDSQNIQTRNMLTKYAGIPDEHIDEVANHLPLQIHESLNKSELDVLLELYHTNHIQVQYKHLPFERSYVIISNINDHNKVNETLSVFFDKNHLPNAKSNEWKSPYPLRHVLSRYITACLEQYDVAVSEAIFEPEIINK